MMEELEMFDSCGGFAGGCAKLTAVSLIQTNCVLTVSGDVCDSWRFCVLVGSYVKCPSCHRRFSKRSFEERGCNLLLDH